LRGRGEWKRWHGGGIAYKDLTMHKAKWWHTITGKGKVMAYNHLNQRCTSPPSLALLILMKIRGSIKTHLCHLQSLQKQHVKVSSFPW
jgi:hypothetical protein